MIFLRDILIFAGLMALAAAVIASLFLVGEGPSAVPTCSDCAFKLVGEYRIIQYGNYASLYLGTREVARYGWAYVEGKPLRTNEMYSCAPEPMYVWVFGGVVHISCRGLEPKVGREIGFRKPAVELETSADWRGPGCLFTVELLTNVANGTLATVDVYDEKGMLVASRDLAIPGSFSFRAFRAGAYRVHIYAPPYVDRWLKAYATARITDLIKASVYTTNNTQDLRQLVSLKIFDLTPNWKSGRSSAAVTVNPRGDYFTVSDTGAFADFLLAWEDCRACDSTYGALYIDEVWLVSFKEKPELRRMRSQGGFWHEIYADGTLIYTWNKDGPENDVYTGSNPSISVGFKSQDGTMNARATFVKECYWG